MSIFLFLNFFSVIMQDSSNFFLSLLNKVKTAKNQVE